ncbi:MAG: ATP-binding protein [Chloroflexi bacterium]|nr:ATP-binding protein [Chloroflexota bacterium]
MPQIMESNVQPRTSYYSTKIMRHRTGIEVLAITVAEHQIIKLDVPECWNQVKLSIADTGSGINPADLPYVFDHFYKADKSRQRLYGNAWIGLALVRNYVELHGGKVWVESAVGKSSTFYFIISISNTSA